MAVGDCRQTPYLQFETGPYHAAVKSPIQRLYLTRETPSVLISGYLRYNTVCLKSQVADTA